MSYWDSTKQETVRFKPVMYEGYPGWARIDCGCCGGIQWGGEDPRECHDCDGFGFLAVHLATGTTAVCPGGPLLGGHLTAKELKDIVEYLQLTSREEL